MISLDSNNSVEVLSMAKNRDRMRSKALSKDEQSEDASKGILPPGPDTILRLVPPGKELGRREILSSISHYSWWTYSMRFFYVYVLYNKLKDYIYICYSTNLKERLQDHEKGFSKTTKRHLPIELIHHEAYKNKKDAKRRERYLKTNRGKTTLMTMLKEFFRSN